MTHKFKWLVKADLMEKLKSEQTLEGGRNINHKLFRGRIFQTKPLGGSCLARFKTKGGWHVEGSE